MLSAFVSLVDCDSPEKQQQQGRCPSSPHSPGTLILGTSCPFEISIHDNQHFYNLSLKALLSKVAFCFWVLNLSLLSWVPVAKGSLRNILRQGLSGPLVLPLHLFQDRHPKIKINQLELMTVQNRSLCNFPMAKEIVSERNEWSLLPRLAHIPLTVLPLNRNNFSYLCIYYHKN